MRELRFSKSIYGQSAVDAAIQSFARYAQIERTDEPEHTVVRISASSPERERRVAGELGNFALGTTVRDLGAP